jgi:hypothetical protein
MMDVWILTYLILGVVVAEISYIWLLKSYIKNEGYETPVTTDGMWLLLKTASYAGSMFVFIVLWASPIAFGIMTGIALLIIMNYHIAKHIDKKIGLPMRQKIAIENAKRYNKLNRRRTRQR